MMTAEEMTEELWTREIDEKQIDGAEETLLLTDVRVPGETVETGTADLAHHGVVDMVEMTITAGPRKMISSRAASPKA